MGFPINHYALKLSVNCGTTCFLRETAPGRKAWLFSSLKLKAASTLSMLALGANMNKVEAAFNFKLENNHAFLPGAVSRKKQVVPQLTESFNA